MLHAKDMFPPGMSKPESNPALQQLRDVALSQHVVSVTASVLRPLMMA